VPDADAQMSMLGLPRYCWFLRSFAWPLSNTPLPGCAGVYP
jgi:hypothetical protein